MLARNLAGARRQALLALQQAGRSGDGQCVEVGDGVVVLTKHHARGQDLVGEALPGAIVARDPG